MNTLFDRDYRALNQSELIYKVTNRREFSKQKINMVNIYRHIV